MKPVIFVSSWWYGVRPTELSRVMGDHLVIPNGGAVLGIMPPYSVLLPPVVPMSGSTRPTFDTVWAARPVADETVRAARLVAANGGVNRATSAITSTTAQARGADRGSRWRDEAPERPGLTRCMAHLPL